MVKVRVLTTILLLQLSTPRVFAAPSTTSAEPSARAGATAAAEGQTTARKSTERGAEDDHRLNWTFPRFRLWQYISSGVVSGANLYLQYGTGEFPDQRWNSPILFDGWARGIRADTPEGRDRAAVVSDYMWHATQYYAVIIDSILVPLAFDRLNVDVAWQMNMLNWQAIGLSFFFVRLSHVTVGRSRPSEHGCSMEPGAAFPCTKGAGPSFMGGHVAMSATGAGLACAHHTALPLYGGGWPDAAACVVLSASAVTIGVLRGVADRHWASDNIIGGLIGGSIGFGLPYLLHYRTREPLSAALLPPNMAFVPLVADDAWGLGIAGQM